MNAEKLNIDPELEKLQRETFGYFLHETNPSNGLVVDKTAEDWPSSIAATSLALACYQVSVERGFMSRPAAVERTLATLRFFWNSPQGSEPDATGYKGFLAANVGTHPSAENACCACTSCNSGTVWSTKQSKSAVS